MGTAADGTYTPLGDVLGQWNTEEIPVGQGGFVDTGGLDTTGGGSSGINAQAIAKALQGLGGGQQQAQGHPVANLPGVSGVAPGGITATSGAAQGNTAGINGLVASLMQRVEALRAASNPATARPVNMASGGVRGPGLLGL